MFFSAFFAMIIVFVDNTSHAAIDQTDIENPSSFYTFFL